MIFSDVSEALLDECRRLAGKDGAQFLLASADDLVALADASVDVVTTRSVLIYLADKAPAFREFRRVLRPGGRLSIFEPINKFSWDRRSPDRFWGYDVAAVRDLADKLMAFYLAAEPSTLIDFDERDLLAAAERAGFEEIHMSYELEIVPRPVVDCTTWDAFRQSSGNPLEPTLQEAMDAALTPEEARRFAEHLRPLVDRGEGRSERAWAYLTAVT